MRSSAAGYERLDGCRCRGPRFVVGLLGQSCRRMAGQDPCWRQPKGPDHGQRGVRDFWSKFEHRFHVSPTANQHDAIDAVELAMADYEAMFGHPMTEDCGVDVKTGEIFPWSRS